MLIRKGADERDERAALGEYILARGYGSFWGIDLERT